MAGNDEVLRRLLARHGRTYAEELYIDLRGNRPPALFQLLVVALLTSARISDRIAVTAAQALIGRGYGSAEGMARASWRDRVDALGEGRYVRYDESTATYLGDTANLLLERYDGDLRRLRDTAGGDPDRVRALLQECKGIGQVGADIFCREVQRVWEELRPFADDAALAVAADLELPTTPQGLARRAGDEDLSVVAAALIRAKLTGDLDVVRSGRDAPPTEIQLDRMTRDELYELARRREVPGRSSMRRRELVEAVRPVTRSRSRRPAARGAPPAGH